MTNRNICERYVNYVYHNYLLRLVPSLLPTHVAATNSLLYFL